MKLKIILAREFIIDTADLQQDLLQDYINKALGDETTRTQIADADFDTIEDAIMAMLDDDPNDVIDTCELTSTDFTIAETKA